MCWTSAVFDQFDPYIPTPVPTPSTPWQIAPGVNPGELSELIAAFYKALEAARTFDRVTGQADCEDPDKAKLLDRISEIERRLATLER